MNKLFLGPGLVRFLLAFTVVVHHSFPLRMGGLRVFYPEWLLDCPHVA